MATKTITSANAVFMLGIETIFPVPVRLQHYSADSMFTSDAIPTAEVSMGVDGRLSAGFIFVPFVQSIMLQADSASNAVFDQWFAQQQRTREAYAARGLITLPSVGKKYNLVRGFLTSYKAIPDAGKVLASRTHQITWEVPVPSNAG